MAGQTICCPSPIRGLALRVTKTDVCGVPVADTTANSRVTTRAFVSATFTPEVEEGSEITQKRADGTICVTDKAPDQLKRLSAEIVACGLPFPLLQVTLSLNAFVDGSGNIIGGALPSRAAQAAVEANEALQLELWQFNKDPAACAGGGASPYVRNIFPLFRNRQIGGTINAVEGAASEITVTGIVEETAAYQPSDPNDTVMDATNITTMQASGPWGYVCEDDLPTATDCAYDAAASGS